MRIFSLQLASLCICMCIHVWLIEEYVCPWCQIPEVPGLEREQDAVGPPALTPSELFHHRQRLPSQAGMVHTGDMVDTKEGKNTGFKIPGSAALEDGADKEHRGSLEWGRAGCGRTASWGSASGDRGQLI